VGVGRVVTNELTPLLIVVGSGKMDKGPLARGGAANPDRQVKGKRFGGRTRRRRETSYMRVGVCRGVEGWRLRGWDFYTVQL